MPSGSAGDGEDGDSGGVLPTPSHLRLRPAGAVAATTGESPPTATWLPAAWSGAFEDPCLLSPMASGAFGRLVPDSCKALPALEAELQAEEARAAAAQAGADWPARAREARNIVRLALPMSMTNFLGFAIGLVTIR